MFWRLYLRNAVLGALRHGVGHGQVIDHHDVLVGLVHRGGRLRAGTDGGAAVLEGGSRRLDLRPLEKLRRGRENKEPVRHSGEKHGNTVTMVW